MLHERLRPHQALDDADAPGRRDGLPGGAVVSIAPVVGNPANDALREADDAVNTAADKVDDLPI